MLSKYKSLTICDKDRLDLNSLFNACRYLYKMHLELLQTICNSQKFEAGDKISNLHVQLVCSEDTSVE